MTNNMRSMIVNSMINLLSINVILKTQEIFSGIPISVTMGEFSNNERKVIMKLIEIQHPVIEYPTEINLNDISSIEYER